MGVQDAAGGDGGDATDSYVVQHGSPELEEKHASAFILGLECCLPLSEARDASDFFVMDIFFGVL